MYYIVKRTCTICGNVKDVKNPDSHDIARLCDSCARKNRPRKRKTDMNGYVKFAQKYIHRILWEKHYGKIPIGFVIHHKNHIRHDNRIENLEILPKSNHDSLHANEFWEGVRNGTCKKPFSPVRKNLDKEKLKYLYSKLNSLRLVAKELNTSHGVIKRYMLEYGLLK